MENPYIRFYLNLEIQFKLSPFKGKQVSKLVLLVDRFQPKPYFAVIPKRNVKLLLLTMDTCPHHSQTNV